MKSLLLAISLMMVPAYANDFGSEQAWQMVESRGGTHITIRDYFACCAVAGSAGRLGVSPKQAAIWAYQIADEMLRIRGQGKP